MLELVIYINSGRKNPHFYHAERGGKAWGKEIKNAEHNPKIVCLKIYLQIVSVAFYNSFEPQLPLIPLL
jgi:hypothetical protein